MEVLFFLKDRTRFIRLFYETAAEPFSEKLRKIEAGEEPYVPEYSEDGEPPFLIEWQEADTGLQILGLSCISMLSEALKLYFQTWEAELHVTWESGERDRYFKNGFVQGYRRCFGELLQITWSDCPTDFDLLEQVTLARNAAQHPEQISTMHVRHNMKSRVRFASPFFVSELELHLVPVENPLAEWFSPNIYVSQEKLYAAIEQVELLGEWVEDRMFAAKFKR